VSEVAMGYHFVPWVYMERGGDGRDVVAQFAFVKSIYNQSFLVRF